MAMGRSTKRFGAGLAFVLAVGTAPARAEDKLLGQITVDAEKVSLTHGLAFTDGNSVTVVFFGAPLTAAEEARALQGGIGVVSGAYATPNVRLDIFLRSGSTQATPATFSSCHVGFYRFKAGLYDWNTNTGCGLLELSGEVKVGGVVHARLKEKTEGVREGLHRPTYAWDIDFTATLRADH